MKREKSLLEVKKVLEDNGYTMETLSAEELASEMADLLSCEDSSPLDITTLFKDKICLSIITYDDCNIYEENGYYIEQLTKITQHSNKKINITDIAEVWQEDGTMTLSFKVNSEENKLHFDLADKDTVPIVFTEFIKKMILNTDMGEFRYIYLAGNEFDNYYLFSNQVIKQLEKIVHFPLT